MANELYFFFHNEKRFREAKGYLLSRANYSAEGDDFIYHNEDTDFAFTADCAPEESDLLETAGLGGPCITFRINYLRPGTYLDEVSIELSAFTEKFADTRFYDEISGSERKFSLGRFQFEWKKTNKSALQERTSEFGIETSSDELVRDSWSWNYYRRTSEIWRKEEFYIAKVMFQRNKASPPSLRTLCTWPVAIPIILPSFVDEVLLMHETKPEGFFGRLLLRNREPQQFVKLVSLPTVVGTGAFKEVELNGFSGLQLVDGQNKKLLELISSASENMESMKAAFELLSAEDVVEKSLVPTR